MFPNAIALVVDGVTVVVGWKLSFVQRIVRSARLRCTDTLPGVATNHVPLSFVILQLAPETSVPVGDFVSMDSDSVEPLTIEAHPCKLTAKKPATTKIFIFDPLFGPSRRRFPSKADFMVRYSNCDDIASSCRLRSGQCRLPVPTTQPDDPAVRRRCIVAATGSVARRRSRTPPARKDRALTSPHPLHTASTR